MSLMACPNITAIILTYNEENNIRHCLKQLTWTDRLVLVDSGSTDRTVPRAKEFGCDIYHNPWPGFAAQRNWALDNTDIQTDWIMFIDADEEVTPEMRMEIQRTLKNTNCSAFYICYKVIFLGQWVKRSSNFPVWHPRIIRKDRARFKDAVTGHGETWDINGRIGYINEPYIHYSFSTGLSSWFEKHNRLSTMECNACFDTKTGITATVKAYSQKTGINDGKECVHFPSTCPSGPYLECFTNSLFGGEYWMVPLAGRIARFI